VARREVFVSYSKPDHDAAHELVSQVEARGIECWVAPRDVQPGAVWAAEIVNAIAAARVMVLVFSTSANSSSQVSREVELAVDRGVRVLPFRIADVEPSGSLKYFLAGQHWVDAFPPPLERHYATLCTCLNTFLATPTNQPPPPPDPPPVPWHQPRPDHVRVNFEAANLRRLESELAIHIGPIAKWVVHRAAAEASNVDGLLIQLGAQIESETERRKFISGCREWLGAPR
jgi:TIR domain-containing protein